MPHYKVPSAAASQPEPEPEPEQPLLTRSFVGDESVDIDIGKGAFKQHDLSATALLLESSPNRVECVATSSENLDHTIYVFKVFTPDGRVWYARILFRTQSITRRPLPCCPHVSSLDLLVLGSYQSVSLTSAGYVQNCSRYFPNLCLLSTK